MAQPGAPGRRLRALGDAFHRTVKYALRAPDAEQFGEALPGVREALVRDLFSAYKQARRRLGGAGGPLLAPPL